MFQNLRLLFSASNRIIHATTPCDEAVDWIRSEAGSIYSTRVAQQAVLQFKQDIHNNFVQQPEWVDDDLCAFWDNYKIPHGERFIKRAQTEAALKHEKVSYVQHFYKLSTPAAMLLRKLDIHSGCHSCYGNQLQHVIHQECIDLLERTAQLEPQSPILEYQDALVYCIDAAQTYNRAGQTHHATAIADFCYTLLDYGKAVLEGTRDGLLGVAQEALNAPLQTITSVTLSVAASEYLLAYQLSRITYGLLQLAVTAVVDREQAKQTWAGYIAPITSIIEALNNKQLSLRDAIRGGTALAVSCKAQSMLAKGCSKLYSTTKAHALEYIAKNPLANPAQYIKLPESIAPGIVRRPLRFFRPEQSVNCNTSGAPCSSQAGPHKNTTTLWNIKYNNTGEALYHLPGKICNAYRDPMRKYWWSKDMQQHGGSGYKVMIYTPKGFHWIKDADQFGNFIKDKHKGTRGLFIPKTHIIKLVHQ